MAGSTLASPSAEKTERFSPGRDAWRRFRRHRLAVVSLGVLAVLVIGVGNAAYGQATPGARPAAFAALAMRS